MVLLTKHQCLLRHLRLPFQLMNTKAHKYKLQIRDQRTKFASIMKNKQRRRQLVRHSCAQIAKIFAHAHVTGL